ncbi:hypothetical protein DYB32_002135 [Aphanomyces invadans]|uniref:Uncharacterized protein n=1 Tax=Aphanomyces invadans TaxID=157072 RepID=A0A3R6VQY8_9STRA|nr:hypothetical protein DYB32_002135 [Aphanomyces invadans]
MENPAPLRRFFDAGPLAFNAEDDEESRVQLIVWVISGTFVLTALITSVKLIRNHLVYFTKPLVQRKIIGILWMVPIYATTSWLSLRFKDWSLFLDMFRDCYEAYVIYLFLALMVAYLGDGSDDRVVRVWYLYLSLIINASVTYAFYYLVLFYLALGTHLKPYNPVPKFLCVKAVLFLSYWQSVVLAFLSRFEIIHQLGSWTTDDVTNGIQNVLICFEMMVIAVVHTYAFPFESFKNDDVFSDALDSGSLRDSILSENFAFDDALRDFNEVMPIVLPSGFKPSSNSRRSDKLLSPARGGKVTKTKVTAYKNLNTNSAVAPEDADRGWKL